jgi:hypothetical protein
MGRMWKLRSLNRADCEEKNDSLVICSVTVKDDLMSALQLDLNVTDTFNIIIKDKKIRSVQTSSNDPDVYYEAKDWIKQNRPELIEKPCEDAWKEDQHLVNVLRQLYKDSLNLRLMKNLKKLNNGQ